MVGNALRVLWQSLAVVAVSAVIAVGTNALRSDGIPLVTDVPYEIFAQCRDSEAAADAVAAGEIDSGDGTLLYVDARPEEEFTREHVDGAINVPYSALFGASADDLERIASAASRPGISGIVVYGSMIDPDAPDQPIELGKPLAQQLVETGLEKVRHMAGGLAALKKVGVPTVQGNEAN